VQTGSRGSWWRGDHRRWGLVIKGGSSWRGALAADPPPTTPADLPSDGRRAPADPSPAVGPTSAAGDGAPAPTASATGLRLASALPPIAGGCLCLRQTKHEWLQIFAKSRAPLGCSVNLYTLMYLLYTIHTYTISQVVL
jgi:hypothetical protein